MPDRIKNYWIQRAANFHRHYQQTSLSLRTFVGKFLNKRTSTLLTFMPASKSTTLLDLGCGSGIHLKIFAPRYKSVIGVDYSQPMIDLAKSELQKLGLRNWNLIMADAHTLPLPDKEFDCVIAMGLLDYVSSPRVVLSEISRVLKTGGVVVATIPKQPSFFSFFRTEPGIVIRRAIFDLPPITNIVTRAQLIDLFHAAGLNPTDIVSLWTTMWMVRATKK